MSSRTRFTDAADVFVAFPRLSSVTEKPAGTIAPLDYARALGASPRPVSAIAFIAHLLPRREAIWWGCQCVGAALGNAARDQRWNVAAAWVRDPDERLRREALDLAQGDETREPTYWLTRAVAYSGGSILASDQPPTQPQVDACALSVNAAIVLATVTQPPQMILPWMRACADAGVRFAEGEDFRIVPPKAGEAQLSPQQGRASV